MEYEILNGSKLEFNAGTTEAPNWKQIKGITTMPDFGSTPNKVDTTTLDNLKYETNINGLIPAVDLTYGFNLEHPSAEANIKLACDLEDAGEINEWKVSFANGIVFTYSSKTTVGIKGGESEDLHTFEMYHAPIGEIARTIPTTEG